jgi:hypothetical protein
MHTSLTKICQNCLLVMTSLANQNFTPSFIAIDSIGKVEKLKAYLGDWSLGIQLESNIVPLCLDFEHSCFGSNQLHLA